MSEAKPGDTPEPQRLGVREYRGNIAGILRRVQKGRSLLVMSRDEVLSELWSLMATIRSERQPGALRGQIRMARDFDALPPDLLAAMEGEAE